MSSKPPKVQWYQSSTQVTASVQLRPEEERRGKLTANFTENHCIIYDGGEVLWESHLANRIVPDKCKLVLKKRCCDVKLTKAEDLQWPEYEVDPPPTKKRALDDDYETTEIAMEQLDLICEQVQDLKDGIEAAHVANEIEILERVERGGSVGGGAGDGRDGGGGDKDEFFDARNDVPNGEGEAGSGRGILEVDHLSHDFYDMGNRIKVKVGVAHISEDTCDVAFEERLMKISFQTSNERFLDMFPGHTPNMTFIWKVELFAAILPESSSFRVLPNNLEVFLVKVSSDRWKTLTPSSHLTPKRDSLKNRLNKEEKEQMNKELLDSISNDRMLNPPLTQSPKQFAITNNTLRESLSSGNMVTMDDRSHQMAAPSPRHISPTSIKRRSQSATPTPDGLTPPSDSDPARENGSKTPTHNHHRPPKSTSSSKSSESNGKEVSLVGLMNIGNSCFMNSTIQCLSNTPILRDFFISNKYISDINKTNPLGFKGDLAKSFAAVVRRLWSDDPKTYFSPRQLKNVIAAKSSNFGGYQQQDSHEFMSYLLDGLHEDLNRVLEKPTTAPVESDGSSEMDDAHLAEKSWEVYRQRNDSYFVDYFQGQFKSTLYCPSCQKTSVTFEPFMSLSVPIPRDMRRLPIYFVPCNPDHTPCKYVLELHPDSNLELLKASVARKTSIPMPQLRVFEVYKGKFQNLLSNNQHSIRSIEDNDVIIVAEVLSRPSQARHKVVEINVIQRVTYPPPPKVCANCKSTGNMKRCTKCMMVGYCTRDCQTKDWAAHKMKCRGIRPVPIGVPFVISMQRSKFTYTKLAEMAEKFARRSLNVELVDGSADTGNSLASLPCPPFSFIPVDRYGDSEANVKPLEDKGDELLDFTGEFLAMDWQTDTKKEKYVNITPKDVLDHETAQSADSFYMMSSSNLVTLNQCIKLLTEPETLSKEEAWYCSKCKEHREATKQISLWRLPRILIIHLKRFSYTGQYNRDKISIKVDFPLEELDMSSFMPEGAMSHHSGGGRPIYDLYATVNHYGAVYMGHYMAQVRGADDNKREWIMYDDERVITRPEKLVVDKNAYILFYQLREKEPANNS